jgi:erythromycin esterase
MRVRERSRFSDLESLDDLIEQMQRRALPLRDPRDLDPLLARIGAARFVLIGEASHGTAEYYGWRVALSQRLIREKGFNFIAVEGDWPDCYRLNRYVKELPDSGASAYEVLHTFDRWPTWMWANWEVVRFAEWLCDLNRTLPLEQRGGFYGLDMYSLWESLAAVTGYLQRTDPDALPAAYKAYNCLEPYQEDAQAYSRAATFVPASCENDVVQLLAELRQNAPLYAEDKNEPYFNAQQNAIVVREAESYYRQMMRGGATTWNIRDRHMSETLARLCDHHGPDSKAIVWAHNTHVGDARYTDMADEGMVNIGQLARERYGDDDVVLVGLGGHHGSVIAGTEWDAPLQRMNVPPAPAGSWEDVFYRGSQANSLHLLDRAASSAQMLEPRGHRAIGVVYHPQYEAFGNYVPTVLPRRYDAFLFFGETQALHPLHVEAHDRGEPPETYPWAV